jgi:hypothetical protein
MSAPGRRKREYRSAQHEGNPVAAPGGSARSRIIDRFGAIA